MVCCVTKPDARMLIYANSREVVMTKCDLYFDEFSNNSSFIEQTCTTLSNND